MHHLPGVEREEDQRQERLREGGAQILDEAAKVDARRLVRGAPLQEVEKGGNEREGNDRETAEGPDERAPRQEGPRGPEEGEERGRHEAAPEVVEDLPLTDERETVLHETLWCRDHREEPGEDLPVAAHPAVLPPRVCEDVGGVVVHHLHVGDERGACVQPLEEIVRQQRVLGDAPADGRLEGVDVVQSLARVDPCAEQVLVGVRDRRRVGIDAGVPGVHPCEERPGGAREVDAHARLEDAVALRDPPEGGVDHGPVERMRDDPDQCPRGAPRESRVGVQGEDVAHRREDRKVADLDGETGVVGGTQQAVELLDLPPLALPPHEDVLFRVPLAIAVEQEETVVPVGRVPAVERLDTGHGRGQDLVVTGDRERLRVLEIAEDREVDPGVEVAERLHLQVRQEPVDLPHAAEEHGHDHHGAGALRDPFAEVEAGKPARWHERRHDALNEEYRELARGQQREQGRGGRHPGGARGAGVRIRTENTEAGQETDAAEVRSGGVGETPPAKPLIEARTVRHVDLEAAPARADEVIADVRCPVADTLLLRGPRGSFRRCAGQRAPAPRRWARRDPPRRAGSGRGWRSPSAGRPRPGPAAGSPPSG